MNILLEHIKIDLQENYGHVPELHEYLEAFSKALPEKYRSNEYLNIGTEAFSSVKDPFFRDIEIEIRVSKITDPLQSDSEMSWYNSENTDFVGKNGKLYGLEIVLNLNISNSSEIRKRLVGSFAHELTHAYESYIKRKSGKSDLTMMNLIKTQGYYDKLIQDFGTGKGGKLVEMVRAFSYLMTSFEKNANIGRLEADLEGYSEEDLRNPEKLKEIVENTFVFKQYREAEKFVNIISSAPKDVQDKLLPIINKLTGHTFSSSSKARLWITSKWSKWDKKFKSTVGKVIGDIIQNQRFSGKSVDFDLSSKMDFDKYWK